MEVVTVVTATMNRREIHYSTHYLNKQMPGIYRAIYVLVVEGTASCSLKIPMNIPYMTYISVA